MANNAPLIGQQIGNYRIAASIAAGAFGIVYQAKHQYLPDRVVAIKVLHMHLDVTEEQQKFLQEAQLLEKLQHPYILSILDVGIFNALPYLITPYAPGGSLRHNLQRRQIPPWHVTLNLLLQTGQALQYAHQQRIIHRDLKPENILLSEKNEVLLADFGIASVLTGQSMKYTQVTGTPAYMAPEQFRGVASPQSDQYSLACIAYELITGQPPFQAPDFISMGFKHASDPVPPPSQLAPGVPKAIEQAILKALSKERCERYANVAAFLSALQTASPQQVSSSPSTLLPTEYPQVRLQGVQGERTMEQWLDESDRLWQIGQKEEALAACEMAVRLNPKSEEALFERGLTLSLLDRYEEALLSHEQVLRLNPDNLRALSEKGYDLSMLDRHEEALIAYEQILRLDQKNINALQRKGFILYLLDRYQESLIAYEQLLRLDPTNAVVLQEKGEVLCLLDRHEEALIAFEQALYLNLKNADTFQGKGQALYGLERYQEALVNYEQALLLDPEKYVCWFNKGDTLYEMQRYREALTAYDQCLRLNPEYSAAYREKGYVLSHLGRYQEAIPIFDQSLRLYSLNARTHTGKGRALAKLGRYQEALACYDAALQLSPNYELAQDLKREALEHLPKRRWW